MKSPVSLLVALLLCAAASGVAETAATTTTIVSKPGSILRQMWKDVSGAAISDLTDLDEFPDMPSETTLLTSFEAPADNGENYGARVVGYVHAPNSGEYLFWIASDDASELWLSTSDKPADKVKIAFLTDYTGPKEWTKFPTQQSQPIKLVAGRKYYIEALHKQGGGGANLAVGWKMADGTMERPIPGKRLSPFVPGKAAVKPPKPLPSTAGHHKMKFEAKIADKVIRMPWLLYLPKDYEKSSDKKPVMIFLHGAGEGGTDLEAIYAHGPNAALRGDPKFADTYPFIGISPQCTPGRRWDDPGQVQAVVQLLDDVLTKYRCDKDRVYVTGLSMGGKGTWLLSQAAPEHFAAITPISAVAVDPEHAGEKLKNVAVRIIAGGNDGDFTNGSKQMNEILTKAGVKVEINVVPGADHGVWMQFYPTPPFWQWFLQFKRPAGGGK